MEEEEEERREIGDDNVDKTCDDALVERLLSDEVGSHTPPGLADLRTVSGR